MKLDLLSENLQKKLSFVNHAVSPRSQLPVLLNILLVAKNGKLIISATDLEIGIQTEIPAKVDEEGAVTVPAKIFTELISTISTGKITLRTKEKTLEVLSQKTQSSFQTIAAEEFPKLYEDKGENILVLDKQIIQKDFSLVVLSASLDDGRPALSGVLIKTGEAGSDELLFVATDGFRLSLKKKSVHLKKAENKEIFDKLIIVPARVIKEIALMKQAEGEVGVAISKKNNQILFFQEDTVLVGRLIDADFPQFEKIIPADFNTQVFFDREEMQKAVKLCAIFALGSGNVIKLSFQKEKIKVWAKSPSVGENEVWIDARLTGEENEIAFNARYLLDILANVEEGEMVFEMTGPLNPGVFKIKDDPAFLHLIMPIRIQAETT